MKNVTILLAVLAMLTLTVPAYGAPAWDGNSDGDGDNVSWHDGLNWDSDTAPASGDTPYITLNAHVEISTSVAVTTVYVGDGYASAPRHAHCKVVSGGSLSTPYYLKIGNSCYKADPLSTFIQEAGTVSGGEIHVGLSAGDNTTGYGSYTMEGGDISHHGIYVGDNGSCAEGTGTFVVDCAGVAGSGPSDSDIDVHYHFLLSQYSTLKVMLDAAGNAGQINVGSWGTGDATLAGELELVVDYTSFTPVANSTTITILAGHDTNTTLSTVGLTIDETNADPNGGHWVILDNDGLGGDLQVQYVPEPATMSLLVIGGIGALLRRRRK